MLIDATHPEETRVVVLRGNRVEEFDFESANRKQLRGNIYLAKVTRVEPSLQAAFIEYGGNRHGFLAFSEIHPDYYQIPVADRQALIDEEERAARAADAEADNRAGRRAQAAQEARRSNESVRSERAVEGFHEGEAMTAASEVMTPPAGSSDEMPAAPDREPPEPGISTPPSPPSFDELTHAVIARPTINLAEIEASAAAEPVPQRIDETLGEPAAQDPSSEVEAGRTNEPEPLSGNITEVNGNGVGEEETVESVGGADAMEEVPERAPRLRRQYKIQEVIKRRQVMLVQVVKEERGTKGAALTTYLSLAGRYSVLMPNTARGGGISRKITDVQDRRRLKELAQELEVPEGMGVILRTAGASRTKTEIKRDFEYLLRLWETVRDLTLKSTAPTLVYEEGSLIKRSIRDLYNKDIDEILVAGDDGNREAREFMRMLMPSHVKNVKPFRDTLPVFTRFGIESQLDAMFQPVVQLRSGGYIVLNQTEALVAIDVNSGRATREHHIEDTALKTNLEAAEEIARQLRLRDLAGLIVIDFIDMDEKRNNRTVERRLKEALKHDRARIQVGHISHFGLLEMSRQRIRSSVLESSTEKCPHCGGTGHVRSVSSVALQLVRAIEEMLTKGATHNLVVRTRTDIALYLLNHKRAHLRALEERFQIAIMVNADANIGGQISYVIEKSDQVHSLEQARAIAARAPAIAPAPEEEEYASEQDEEDELESATEAETEAPEFLSAEGSAAQVHHEEGGAGEAGMRRRRRRRRGRRGGEAREREEEISTQASAGAEPPDEDGGDAIEEDDLAVADSARGSDSPVASAREETDHRRRRRGRRGGRRNRRGEQIDVSQESEAFQRQDREGVVESALPADTEVTGHAEASPLDEPTFTPPPVEWHEVDASASDRGGSVQSQDVQSQEKRPLEPEPINEEHSPLAKEAERARRRSTVREPAPGSSAATHAAPLPVPDPQPAIAESAEATEESGRPRRAGWWNRRAAGKA
jgi:ribonuclease E